ASGPSVAGAVRRRGSVCVMTFLLTDAALRRGPGAHAAEPGRPGARPARESAGRSCVHGQISPASSPFRSVAELLSAWPNPDGLARVERGREKRSGPDAVAGLRSEHGCEGHGLT